MEACRALPAVGGRSLPAWQHMAKIQTGAHLHWGTGQTSLRAEKRVPQNFIPWSDDALLEGQRWSLTETSINTLPVPCP